jgi:hypothetical protein
MMEKVKLAGLSMGLLMVLASCSTYFAEFDAPVYDGVKNHSVTDLERSIIELPGDKQDRLVTVSDCDQSACMKGFTQSCHAKRIWICGKVDSNGQMGKGYYKTLTEEN